MRFSTILASIALLLSALFGYLYFDLKQQLKLDKAGNEHKEYPVVETMHKFQLYTNKLFFAGKGQNWELANFYVHEIEEYLEELEAAGVKEDGHDLSSLAAKMTAPGIEQLEKGIHQKDSALFTGGYQLLLNGCNNCHAVTEHAFIRIENPSAPAFSNQGYVPARDGGLESQIATTARKELPKAH